MFHLPPSEHRNSDELVIRGEPERRLRRWAGTPALQEVRKLRLVPPDGQNQTLGEGALPALLASRYCRLETLDLNQHGLHRDDLHAIARAQNLTQLRTLSLRSCGLRRSDDFEPLLRSRHLRGLEALDLGFNQLGTVGAEALVAAKPLASLRMLRLGSNGLTRDAFEAIARASHLRGARIDLRESCLDFPMGAALSPQLDSVFLTGRGLSAARGRRFQPRRLSLLLWEGPKVGWFLRSRAMQHVEHLSLLAGQDAAPPDLALPDLIESRQLHRLRDLECRGEAIPLDVVSRLAEWPGLAKLERLVLAECELDAKAIARLAASPHLHRLRHLVLDWNPLGNAGAIALSRAPWLANLETLSLISTSLRGRGVHALVRRLGPSLRILDLAGNHIGLAGANAIAAGDLARIEELHLGSEAEDPDGFDLGGDEGVIGLIRGSQLRSLRCLGLDRSNLTDATALALARATHLTHLGGLFLNWNPITARGRRALAAAPHLRSLTHFGVIPAGAIGPGPSPPWNMRHATWRWASVQPMTSTST